MVSSDHNQSVILWRHFHCLLYRPLKLHCIAIGPVGIGVMVGVVYTATWIGVLYILIINIIQANILNSSSISVFEEMRENNFLLILLIRQEHYMIS